MKVTGVKNCLRILASSVVKFKREDSSPTIQEATDNYNRIFADEKSTDREVSRAYKRFDRATSKWFSFHSAIEKVEDTLHSTFTRVRNREEKLDYKLLFKVMRALPSDEARHLLVLAIKHYSLSRKDMERIENMINRNEDLSLEELVARTPQLKVPPKASLSHHYKGKEERTFKEILRVSETIDIKTLMPKASLQNLF